MGSQDGRRGTYVTAATAAKERADECRRRRAELFTGAPVNGSDRVARAGEHLVRAMERARVAERRLANIAETHRFNQALRRAGISSVDRVPDLPPRLEQESVVTPLAAELLESIATGTAAVLDLWIAFATRGGVASFIEFDGYVNGAWSMSAPDRQLLAQVYWDHATFGRAGS